MTEALKTLQLEELIKSLEALPEGATVRGLGSEIESYRGYYERNAIAPSTEPVLAKSLAKAFTDQVGKPIYGYKGGDYTVSLRENVYLADYGNTGPNICGFVADEEGVYRPVLVEVNEW